MMDGISRFVLALSAAVLPLAAQADIVGLVNKHAAMPRIAVPDFRGAGAAQDLAGVFNATLWNDLDQSGVVALAPKTMYPTVVPQQPSDLLTPRPDIEKAGGRLMSDWARPPVEANYLAFGYAAAKDDVFAAFCYFYDLSQPTPRQARVIGSLFDGSLDEAGARKAAHDFAAAILKQFGVTSIAGSHIYYVSNRTGHKEIWVMDWDGGNQRQLTHFNFIATSPSLSPDGSRLTCTAQPAEGRQPRIYLFSVDPLHALPFRNPAADYDAHASFTPDGKHLLFDSAANDAYRIYMSDLDGGNARVINSSQQIQVQPVMNPKNPNLIAVTSGRGGTPQIYTMNADGGDVTRITNGIGEAHNPAWDPSGGHIAFAWSQGYEPGKLNIFLIDPATRDFVQLTHGQDKNENPSWGPDGAHIVFSSTPPRKAPQIWTMLANGTQLKQLTTEGANSNPWWSY